MEEEAREAMLNAVATLTGKAEEAMDASDALAFAQAAKELAEGAWWAGELKPASEPEDGADGLSWEEREKGLRDEAVSWFVTTMNKELPSTPDTWSRIRLLGAELHVALGGQISEPPSERVRGAFDTLSGVQGADPEFP